MIILDMEKPNSCAECELRFCGICEQGYDKEPCPIKAEISDSATNGKVIKTLFPKDDFFDDIFLEVMHYSNYEERVAKWWNAPYEGIKNE